MNPQLGKTIIILGLAIVAIGSVIYFGGDKLKWLGNLPGDIKIDRGNTKVFIPITTMVLLSVVLNLLIRLWRYLT